MKTDMSSQFAQESLSLDSSDVDYSRSTWQTTEQPSTTFVGRKGYPMQTLRARTWLPTVRRDHDG